MLQHQFLSIRIPEAHIAEFHVSLQRLPVFFLWMKGIPILLNYFRTVCDIAFRLHQLGKAFDIDLNRNNARNCLCQHIDWIHNANRIGNKDRQCSDFHDRFRCQHAALPQYQCQCDGTYASHQRRKDCAIMHGMNRSALHVCGFGPEVCINDIFNCHRLD